MRKHHYPQISAQVLFQRGNAIAVGYVHAAGRRMSVAERTRVLSYLLRMCYWDRQVHLSMMFKVPSNTQNSEFCAIDASRFA